MAGTFEDNCGPVRFNGLPHHSLGYMVDSSTRSPDQQVAYWAGCSSVCQACSSLPHSKLIVEDDCKNDHLGAKEYQCVQKFKRDQVMVHYHYPSVYLERLETLCPSAKAGLWEVFDRNGIPRSAAVELKRRVSK